MVEPQSAAADVAVKIEPTLLGLAPSQWVSLAMLALIVFAIFGAKVHKTIAAGLDGRIEAIRRSLEEAKALRAEAEALRNEYAARIARAEDDAAAGDRRDDRPAREDGRSQDCRRRASGGRAIARPGRRCGNRCGRAADRRAP